jgi:murein L,D-transpeptidase YcbB/YkuD
MQPFSWTFSTDPPPPSDDAVAQEIRVRVEGIWTSGGLRVGKRGVASVTLLPALYAAREFQPPWADARAARELLGAIRESDADGLEPADYHQAELDLLLTDALIRLAYHLYFGKVDPAALHPNWNFSRDLEGTNPEQAIRTAIEQGRIASRLDTLRPTYSFYQALRAALSQYRAIAAVCAASSW